MWASTVLWLCPKCPGLCNHGGHSTVMLLSAGRVVTPVSSLRNDQPELSLFYWCHPCPDCSSTRFALLPLFHVLAFPLSEETLLCNSTVCSNQMCSWEAVCMHKLKDKACGIAEFKNPGWPCSAQVIWSVWLGTREVKERSHSNHWAEVDPECGTSGHLMLKVNGGQGSLLGNCLRSESMKFPSQDSFIVFISRAIWSWSQCMSLNGVGSRTAW